MRSIHGSSNGVTRTAKLDARCRTQTAKLLTCVTESCTKSASSKAAHDARAGHRTGFFRAPASTRGKNQHGGMFHCSGIVFHCYRGTGVTARRSLFPAFHRGFLGGRDRRRHCYFIVINNGRTPTCADPYPPRAARNSCGVVPVCLRKNLAKWEGSENARS